MTLDNLIKNTEHKILKLKSQQERFKEVQKSLNNLYYLSYHCDDDYKTVCNFFKDERLSIHKEIKSETYLLKKLLKNKSTN